MIRVEAGSAVKLVVSRLAVAGKPSSERCSGTQPFHRTRLTLFANGMDKHLELVVYSDKPLRIEEGKCHEA